MLSLVVVHLALQYQTRTCTIKWGGVGGGGVGKCPFDLYEARHIVTHFMQWFSVHEMLYFNTS